MLDLIRDRKRRASRTYLSDQGEEDLSQFLEAVFLGRLQHLGGASEGGHLVGGTLFPTFFHHDLDHLCDAGLARCGLLQIGAEWADTHARLAADQNSV